MVEKITKKIISFIRENNNEQKEKEQSPEKIAREAVLLVNAAGRYGQNPLATYEKDFDLRQHKPGTVFRVKLESRKTTSYAWYVIGQSGEEVVIFYVIPSIRNIDRDTYYLELHPDWCLHKIHPSSYYFQIEEANYKLHGYHGQDHASLEDPEWADWVYKSTAIDVIHSGKTIKVSEEEKVRAGVRSLSWQTKSN